MDTDRPDTISIEGPTATKTPPKKPLVREIPPVVNQVGLNDLLECLGMGLRDFRAAPLYGLFFSGIYTVGGWFLILLLLLFNLPALVYPLTAGFALIAPFIASGFYVVSYRLELVNAGQPDALSWGVVLSTLKTMFGRELGWMALVTVFTLIIWMDIAAMLAFGFMGFELFSFSELQEFVFNTTSGLVFLAVGNAVGAAIAFCVFSYSAVSIPMLFDRDIDFVTAMITSVRFVWKNFTVMAVWCVIIAFLIGISILSALVGLLIVLPVLGHASWHLYRRAVEPQKT